MRNELNILVAAYAWLTVALAVVTFGFTSVWAPFWTCVVFLGLAIVARIGYAVYDAGRRSAGKEEK